MNESIRVEAVQMGILAAQPEANLARMCDVMDIIDSLTLVAPYPILMACMSASMHAWPTIAGPVSGATYMAC